MNYAFVENGSVADGPRALPNGWRNISGLCYMDEAGLKELGWLPYEVIDMGGEVLESVNIRIEADKVVETRIYRYKTNEEIAKELEGKKALVRRDRNARLTACDWTQLDDTPLDNVQKVAWANYRQALRDVPSQPGFPNDVVWPVAP